ncbi:MAG: oligosaccharide flippase family protein, partial [Candidatus Ranarchaeia archaeon]
MEETQQIMAHSTYNLLEQISTLVLSAITSIFVARFLGPNLLGIFATMLLLLTFLFGVLPLGLNAAMVKFIPSLEVNEKKKVFEAIFSGLVIILILSVVCSLILYFGSSMFVIPFIRISEWLPLLQLLLLFVPVALFNELIKPIMQGLRRFDLRFFLSLSSNGLYLVLIYWFLLADTGLTGVVYAFVIRSLVLCFVSLVVLIWALNKNGVSPNVRNAFNSPLLKRMLGFGKWMFIASIFQFFRYQADSLAIVLLLTPSDMGYYNIAVKLAAIVGYIGLAIQLSLDPTMSKLNAKDKKELMQDILRQTVTGIYV